MGGTDVPLLPVPSSEAFQAKVAALKEKIVAGDIASMKTIATAGISLISIFHIDQLPTLMPTYMALQPGGDAPAGTYAEKQAALEAKLTDMDVIKMVSIWAVSCFAKYHPDVVVMMGLVEKD